MRVRSLLGYLCFAFALSLLLSFQAKAVGFSLNKSAYLYGDNIVANWTRSAGEAQATTDWIGIYNPAQTPSGASPSLRWFYLNGSRTAPGAAVVNGSLTFTAPGLNAGTYVARFFSNDSYTEIAPAITFTVSAVPSFTLNKTTYTVGESITATWTRSSTDVLSTKDWVAFYRPTQTVGTDYSLLWNYLNGSHTAPAAAVQSGTTTFTAPTLAAGSYVARFLANDGYTEIAPSVSFTITAGGGPAIPAFVMANAPLRYATVAEAYSGCVRGYAKDADAGDVLAFAKVAGPAWLAVAADGTLSGTPAVGDVGKKTFSVSATDLLGNATTGTFSIEIFAPGTAHVDRLKVLSYNLFHGWGMVNNGVRKGLDSIILSGADVVCTIESTDNVTGSGLFQPQKIAEELGWYYARIPGGSDVGVVSRYPITATYSASTAVGAKIRVCANPLQELIVYSAHLDYLHYGPYEAARAGSTNASTLAEELASQRDEQAAALVSYLQPQLAAADTTPVLVCGDFNCPSHQDWTPVAASLHSGKVIQWPATLALTNAGLVDTFRKIHPDPVAVPGNTWAPIYSGDEPLDRIDFIFSKGSGIKTTGSEMFHTAVETTLNNYSSPIGGIANNTWPSDHAAVLTEFQLRPTDANQNGLPDHWDNLHFAPGSNQTSDTDEDHDGISNLLEYAAGTSPVQQDAARIFNFQRNPDGARVSYLRRNDGLPDGLRYSAAGVRYRVLQSEDLEHWSAADEILEADGVPVALGEGREKITLRVLPSSGSARRFFKLAVEQE